MLGLRFSFREIQKLYAVVGASFMPLLGLALLILNGRADWVGRHRNRPATIFVLLATVLFFLLAGWFQVRKGFL